MAFRPPLGLTPPQRLRFSGVLNGLAALIVTKAHTPGRLKAAT